MNSQMSTAPPRPGQTHYFSQVYSFVPIPGTQQHKRPRRRYEEIERIYKCGWHGCEKAYGTLNHLNAHVTMQSHGPKRVPEEFKEIRREWKARKKEEEAQRRAAETRERNASAAAAAAVTTAVAHAIAASADTAAQSQSQSQVPSSQLQPSPSQPPSLAQSQMASATPSHLSIPTGLHQQRDETQQQQQQIVEQDDQQQNQLHPFNGAVSGMSATPASYAAPSAAMSTPQDQQTPFSLQGSHHELGPASYQLPDGLPPPEVPQQQQQQQQQQRHQPHLQTQVPSHAQAQPQMQSHPQAAHMPDLSQTPQSHDPQDDPQQQQQQQQQQHPPPIPQHSPQGPHAASDAGSQYHPSLPPVNGHMAYQPPSGAEPLTADYDGAFAHTAYEQPPPPPPPQPQLQAEQPVQGQGQGQGQAQGQE
ncbi:hypothetical protein KEM52_005967 [Ascosphaera acerosa]|nr:hypothetical protein KEM52_005967 [Ascosphaera acerosa]